MTALKLSRAWSRQIFFTLTEHGAIRVLDALTTLILIRVLSAHDFGLFSVYQSGVAMALLFFPAIEIALFRDYSRLKREGTLAAELAVYRYFNYLKLAALLVLIFALSLAPQEAPWLVRIGLLSFAFALPFSQAFYSFMREPLRFEMRQHIVSIVGIAQRAFLVLTLIILSRLAPGNVPLLLFGALFTYIAAGWGWWFTSREFFQGMPLVPEHAYEKIKKAFFHIVLWIHLGGVITQVIQTLDVFALNIFNVELAEIGRYGIALKAANFFQILPIALASSFGVYLARNHPEDRGKEPALVLRYSFLFVLLTGTLFALGMVVGEPLLAFLAKGKLDAESLARTSQYFRWQLAGVLILCAGYPLTTYLAIRGSLAKLFFQAGLPWLVISAVTYFWASSRGALIAAQANVIVASANIILHAFYYFRRRASDIAR